MFFDSLVHAVLYPVCSWIFLNGLDDFFVDAWFLRCTKFGRSLSNIPLAQFTTSGVSCEKRLAVFVPLWNESAVIEKMVDHNLAAIDYGNYEVFLGVYPNDPKTIEKALSLSRKYTHLHYGVCPHDGPTNKADCLNWIYERMQAEERSRGIRYEVIVQHDAEDIIHPKAFRLIDQLIGDYDMVQVPVFPLERSLSHFTSGTYKDEFAEFQLKDLCTRQSLGGFLPSAGVGTAFRRAALDQVAAAYENAVYSTETLTEDYDIGLKFQLHGKRQCLAHAFAPRVNVGDGESDGEGNGRTEDKQNGRNKVARRRQDVELIATREYFPDTFRNAVRQKSRWVTGIALQTWEHFGWRGPHRNLYWYWRDRKGLVGNLVSLVSNLIFVYCALAWLVARVTGCGWTLADVFPGGGVFAWLLVFNAFFLFERLAFKFYAVNRVYGHAQAFAAIARTPWANVINFSSTAHALFTYFRAKLLGAKVKWAKTSHAFPSRDELAEYVQRKRQLRDETSVRQHSGQRWRGKAKRGSRKRRTPNPGGD